MSVCIFFGHRDCYSLEREILYRAIENLILNGVDIFYVGHQGSFDSMVLGCLRKLKEKYRHISFSVVLAYLLTNKTEFDLFYDCSIYPEGLETAHPKFAIEKRNRWLIEQADYCLCYINHTWGGAYKFARKAKERKITVINLGTGEV